jgi:hypothetical protein
MFNLHCNQERSSIYVLLNQPPKRKSHMSFFYNTIELNGERIKKRLVTRGEGPDEELFYCQKHLKRNAIFLDYISKCTKSL